MNFPLEFRFKTLAISQQISVMDAAGQLIWYVKMKAFKLREAVTVFADEQQTRPLFEIQADRVIDIGASYAIRDVVTQAPIGMVHNKGMRSLWRANYEIVRDGRVMYTVREENPWVKVVDGLLTQIPVVGMFSGYLLHPRYIASSADGVEVLRMRKEAAFFEGRYSVEQAAPLGGQDETLLMIGVLMIVMLERSRG